MENTQTNTKKYTEAQIRAKQKYAKKQTKIFMTLFPKDKDIIEHLENLTIPKAEYIRKLIREDIARGNN